MKDRRAAPLLSITTYNIHKGFSPFNRRMAVHDLRDRLREMQTDIVFLQEVQGLHAGHAEKHENWPAAPQHEFLAEDVWHATAYGRNAVYQHGHHGNAILSRFPIIESHNQDVTHFQFERRGVLHCALDVPKLPRQLHCVCVHLSLFGRSRRRQLTALADKLDATVPGDAPLIVAGDFNDWGNRAHDLLARRLGMTEVFGADDRRRSTRPPLSYPAMLPFLRLDRIYVRGFRIASTQVHFGSPWARISDHAALSASLVPG